MFSFKNKFGFSFSWKRLLGISDFRNSIARKTGIPITRGGTERKISGCSLLMAPHISGAANGSKAPILNNPKYASVTGANNGKYANFI
jgi:hypothetical protein